MMYLTKFHVLIAVLLLALVVTSCSEDDSVSPDPVTVSIDVLPNPVLTGKMVAFNAIYTGERLASAKYMWDFGDGNDTTIVDSGIAHHVYANVGEYSVTLVVSDNASGTVHIEGTVLVTVLPFTGQLAITPETALGVPNVSDIVFGCNYSGPPLSEPRYVWNFSDGTAEVSQDEPGTVSHRFTEAGEYTVTCKLFDGTTLIDAATATAIVTAGDYVRILKHNAKCYYRVSDTLVAVFTGPGPRPGDFIWKINGVQVLVDKPDTDTSRFVHTFTDTESCMVRVEMAQNTALYDETSVEVSDRFPGNTNTIEVNVTGTLGYYDSTKRSDGTYTIYPGFLNELSFTVTTKDPFGSGEAFEWNNNLTCTGSTIGPLNDHNATYEMRISPDGNTIDYLYLERKVKTDDGILLYAIRLSNLHIYQEQFPQMAEYKGSGSAIVKALRHELRTGSPQDTYYRSTVLVMFDIGSSDEVRVTYRKE